MKYLKLWYGILTEYWILLNKAFLLRESREPQSQLFVDEWKIYENLVS